MNSFPGREPPYGNLIELKAALQYIVPALLHDLIITEIFQYDKNYGNYLLFIKKLPGNRQLLK